MSVVGKVVRGRAVRVRCDGCGRISSDREGYYFDKVLQQGGNISSKGRECEHDFCDECERKNAPYYQCPKCGAYPNDTISPVQQVKNVAGFLVAALRLPRQRGRIWSIRASFQHLLEVSEQYRNGTLKPIHNDGAPF